MGAIVEWKILFVCLLNYGRTKNTWNSFFLDQTKYGPIAVQERKKTLLEEIVTLESMADKGTPSIFNDTNRKTSIKCFCQAFNSSFQLNVNKIEAFAQINLLIATKPIISHFLPGFFVQIYPIYLLIDCAMLFINLINRFMCQLERILLKIQL